jgi:hypothetical protein
VKAGCFTLLTFYVFSLLLNSKVMKILGGNACAINHFCTHYLRDLAENFDLNNDGVLEKARQSCKHAAQHVSYDGIDDSEHATDVAVDSEKRILAANSSSNLNKEWLMAGGATGGHRKRTSSRNSETWDPMNLNIGVAQAMSQEDFASVGRSSSSVSSRDIRPSSVAIAEVEVLGSLPIAVACVDVDGPMNPSVTAAVPTVQSNKGTLEQTAAEAVVTSSSSLPSPSSARANTTNISTSGFATNLPSLAVPDTSGKNNPNSVSDYSNKNNTFSDSDVDSAFSIGAQTGTNDNQTSGAESGDQGSDYFPARMLRDTDEDMATFVQQRFNPAYSHGSHGSSIQVNQNIPFSLLASVMSNVLCDNGYRRSITEADSEFLFALAGIPEGNRCPRCNPTDRSVCPDGCNKLSEWWKKVTTILSTFTPEFEAGANSGDYLIHGFLTREQCEKMLRAQSIPVSTFIIRFSERKPGTLTMSYKAPQGAIRHLTVNIDIAARQFHLDGNPTKFSSLSGAVLSAGAGDCALLYPGIDKKAKFPPR